MRENYLDATPDKRMFLSIIADYDLNKCVCELIDNACDIWIKNDRVKALVINIKCDYNQKVISITDNAGGVQEKDLRFLLSPGATTNQPEDDTIGIFGVGSKRAVVALAEQITITTRFGSKDTFQIRYDNAWLQDLKDWHLPYHQVNNIAAETTTVELSKLRKPLDKDIITKLSHHLSETYAHFLVFDNFKIRLNDVLIRPVKFDNWAFPPGYEPRHYLGRIHKRGRIINVSVTAGLINESSPATGEYGVYFYCNERLIAKALKTPEVGFIKGIIGVPHASLSIGRVIVNLRGAASDMPWNSSKSNIDADHETFGYLRNWLLEIAKNYFSLARRLEGNWHETVFKYTEGKIINVPVVDFQTGINSYLLELPPSNETLVEKTKRRNSLIVKTKPWTKGIYESVVAAQTILRQKQIETRNRIALIVLDSSLEIAMKEYLVNDSGNHYSNPVLQNLFSKRHLVHQEIQKYISKKDFSKKDWGKINYYYNQRNKLTHERASIVISDSEIEDMKKLVQKLLGKLFKLKF